MHHLDAFRKGVSERILRVRLPVGADAEKVLEPVFANHLSSCPLVALETAAGGTLQELSIW